MAIYVDEPRWRWRGKLWCHMAADSLDELHTFAQRLGLRRDWFQGPPTASFPHYDLTETKRQAALRLGAIDADDEVILRKVKGLRDEMQGG
jgi:Protein of unknown function (DUF4031)